MHKRTPAEIFKEYILIVIGAVLYAAGFQFFFYPNDIITGGVTGISMIFNFLTGFPVGTMIIIINIPMFFLAWRQFGVRFMIGSLVGMGLSSILVDVFAMMNLCATDNLLLACIYGGLFTGVGLGLIYLAGVTTGGVDIVAKLVRKKKPYFNLGTVILMMDIVVISSFALTFNKFESAMYAIIGMFISARAIDTVLYGLNTSKICYIISDENQKIQSAITQELQRGVTLLHGEGAYTGTPKKVIFCAIKKQQIADIRRIIRIIDPHAFFIVTDSKDVFGDGFGDIYGD